MMHANRDACPQRARQSGKPDNVIRIAVIPERYGRVISPCASIRLHPFFDYFKSNLHADVRYLLPSEVTSFSPDIVVWHRASVPHADEVFRMRDMALRIGSRLIYDIDDNLLEMEGHGEQSSYQGVTDAVRASLQVADEVWCSTPNLIEKVRLETDEAVRLMPNVLDPDLWMLEEELPQPRKMREGPMKLLYMGTRTHDADFELLYAAFEQLERRCAGKFHLSVIGVRSVDSVRAPWLEVLTPPPGTGASYPAFVHWFRRLEGFHAGVAPLVSSRFNACKSPIKILDYAAIGLATLASKVPAYTHSFTNRLNSVHVENTAEAWVEALANLLDAPEPLQSIAAEVKQSVMPARFIEAARDRWNRIEKYIGA
jgi:hypothetical protein